MRSPAFVGSSCCGCQLPHSAPPTFLQRSRSDSFLWNVIIEEVWQTLPAGVFKITRSRSVYGLLGQVSNTHTHSDVLLITGDLQRSPEGHCVKHKEESMFRQTDWLRGVQLNTGGRSQRATTFLQHRCTKGGHASRRIPFATFEQLYDSSHCRCCAAWKERAFPLLTAAREGYLHLDATVSLIFFKRLNVTVTCQPF